MHYEATFVLCVYETMLHVQSILGKPMNKTTPSNNTTWQCGLPKVPVYLSRVPIKMMGSSETDIDSFPWTVMIISRFGHSSGSQFCGGVIISKRYVMTAAHCLKSDQGIRTVSVYYGQTVRAEVGDATKNTVARYCIHQEYNGITNDLALIELSSDISAQDVFSPICLPSKDLTVNLVGKQVTIAGWGKKSDNGWLSASLRYNNFTVIKSKSCLGFDTAKLICLDGQREKGVCGGDSGSPVIVYKNGLYHVVGIVSFSKGSCTKKSGHADVTQYVDWINTALKKGLSKDRCESLVVCTDDCDKEAQNISDYKTMILVVTIICAVCLCCSCLICMCAYMHAAGCMTSSRPENTTVTYVGQQPNVPYVVAVYDPSSQQRPPQTSLSQGVLNDRAGNYTYRRTASPSRQRNRENNFIRTENTLLAIMKSKVMETFKKTESCDAVPSNQTNAASSARILRATRNSRKPNRQTSCHQLSPGQENLQPIFNDSDKITLQP